jgi:hypothetical protein
MHERDYQAAARSIVATLGPTAARELLLLLESDDDARPELFRQLYERGTNEALLDAMTDLEANPVVRGCLVEHLRLELGAA